MNKVQLPAGTVLGKSFEYGLDVNLGPYGSPDWRSFRRISGFAPTFPAVTDDVATYDDLGATNEDVTGRSAAIAFNAQGNRSLATGLYLPELEMVLAAAKAKGEAAVIDARWYHKPEVGTPNPNDAGRAFFRVEASRTNTGNTGVENWSITLTGKGEFSPIVNPFLGWAVTAPQITSVGPAGSGDGALVSIIGSGFLGATAVHIDGDLVDPDLYQVIGMSTIVVILPPGDAGPVDVTVTTAGGTSTAYVFTRGA